MEYGRQVNMTSDGKVHRQFPIIEELAEEDDVEVVYPDPIWSYDLNLNQLAIIPASTNTALVQEYHEHHPPQRPTGPQDSMIAKISKAQAEGFVRFGVVISKMFTDAGKILQESVQQQQQILVESGIKLPIKVPEKLKRQLMRPQSKLIVQSRRGGELIDIVGEVCALIGTELIRRQSKPVQMIHKVPVASQAYDLGMTYLRGFASFYGMLYHVGMSAVDATEATLVETIKACVASTSHLFGDDIGDIAEETAVLLAETYMAASSVKSIVEVRRIMEKLADETIVNTASNVGEKAINEAISDTINNFIGQGGLGAGKQVNSVIRNIAAMLGGTSMETGDPIPGAETEELLNVTFDDVE
ncbi:hypothetical protein J8273_5366 [Carpediemonas membranifera]|uniref:Uncharacterized protein n=1 Tax=Carpediemonas membranifera TaxID=201153 RepID=A0A8J6BWE8_9EUKA|nr:hypothetical protein J8273_5366 [Carpediemonas membranifera]|eukprot:KAG9392376.1 hypothetical protein J8273_5366 [Carpediemonas membranifera]